MSERIEHSGFVTRVEGKNIQVQIIQMSACSSCHAKGACSAADMDEKFVDVESTDDTLRIGDMVNIVGESSTGLLAVLLAFVIPFMLILTSLFVLRDIVPNEAVSGTVSLALLIPYYIILSLFNKKLKRKLQFRIEKK
ncbi:MAG: SoxR reducing system RseC family protein [Paludibacter sp.]|jgi:sigma-E factor negative regulatory protein RseC|nr:SoxR reducing system RseC family protein [Paludibacter sp.]MDX9920103.1 SoxR reducing system RseC family protein [Paludibacter sp.]